METPEVRCSAWSPAREPSTARRVTTSTTRSSSLPGCRSHGRSAAVIAPSPAGLEGPGSRHETRPMQSLAPVHEPTEYELVRGTRAALELVAGKWTIEVLYLLAGGTRRYSEIYYEVGEISKKVLTRTLRALERDGLVSRTVHVEVPLRVEYSLTRLGWSLTGPLMTVYEWSAEYLEPSIAATKRHGETRRLHIVPEPEPAA